MVESNVDNDCVLVVDVVKSTDSIAAAVDNQQAFGQDDRTISHLNNSQDPLWLLRDLLNFLLTCTPAHIRLGAQAYAHSRTNVHLPFKL